MEQPRIVTRDEWLAARRDLLIKEKAMTRAKDVLSAERRRLPMVKVDKSYVFDAPSGRKTLAELFDGRSQLIVYHFMMGPDWAEGCASCSFLADHIDAAVVHLAHRDVTLIAVSRAPLANIEAFRKRMGWRFTWASSFGNDFNHDYGVSFTDEEIASGRALHNFESIPFPLDEAPGLSVFFKTDSATCSTLTRRMRAAEKRSSTRTTISISCRRVATRMASRLRCPGCGTTIGTTRATRTIRRGRMCRRPASQQKPRQAPAPAARRTSRRSRPEADD